MDYKTFPVIWQEAFGAASEQKSRSFFCSSFSAFGALTASMKKNTEADFFTYGGFVIAIIYDLVMIIRRKLTDASGAYLTQQFSSIR